MTVLLVLLALLAIGFVIHQIYVRPPDIPTHENQEAGTDPAAWGLAGGKTCIPSFWWAGMMAKAAAATRTP